MIEVPYRWINFGGFINLETWIFVSAILLHFHNLCVRVRTRVYTTWGLPSQIKYRLSTQFRNFSGYYYVKFNYFWNLIYCD
jgi:hypothetical protein